MHSLSHAHALRLATTFGVLAVAWHVAATQVNVHYLLPTPIAVLEAGYKAVASGDFLSNLGFSLLRAFSGYALAAVLAIPTGILTGWWRPIDDTLGSIIELLRPIPSLALIPLVVVWFGFQESSKVMVIAYACFFSIYITTYAGVKNVDPLYVNVMKIYGNGQRDIITKVVLYSMLPYTFTGLRYAAAVSLILLVAVEIVGAQNGLAFSLVIAQQFLRTGEIYFVTIVFGVLGFVFNGLVLVAEHRVIRWRQSPQG
jgi:ABC-type nitrate/sulfonate/bicarbonate transport system permease component